MNSYSVKCKSLRYESERLLTFINWPFGSLAKSLAWNGFYRKCPDDLVCYFCGICINVEDYSSLIEKGSGYINMKNIHYKSCPFICGNSSMNVTREQEILISEMMRRYCKRYAKRTRTLYKTPKKRFLSFTNFPNRYCNVNRMAESGFYFTGEMRIFV